MPDASQYEYTAHPEVLSHLSDVDFVAVIGPSASGKTTLIDAVIQADPSLHIVKVMTSRSPRPGEVDGADFYFRTQEEMEEHKQRGDFVQVAPTIFGPMYATLPEDYATEGTAIMPVLASAMPVFLELPFKRIRQIFILPPSADEWFRRLSVRNFDDAQRTKRLQEAHDSLTYAISQPDLTFIYNDDIATATAELMSIIAGRPARLKQQEGRKLAENLLEKL